MQKISSYLYSNRIQLIADVATTDAAYPVEWKIVYQRPVKIYLGVDNVLEFDIKNSDQKRIELVTTPSITDIKLNVMDAMGNSVGQYDVTPSTIKGIATVTIPSIDLEGLQAQFLSYSLTCTKDSSTVLLYADSKFGANGTLELAGGAMPVTRPVRHFDDFQQETNWNGHTFYDRIITYFSSSIPVKFYEAVPTTLATISINVTGFIGTITIEATKRDIMGHEAFLPGFGQDVSSQTFSVARTGTVDFTDIDTTDYTYLRVKYTKTAGTLDNFSVIS